MNNKSFFRVVRANKDGTNENKSVTLTRYRTNPNILPVTEIMVKSSANTLPRSISSGSTAAALRNNNDGSNGLKAHSQPHVEATWSQQKFLNLPANQTFAHVKHRSLSHSVTSSSDDDDNRANSSANEVYIYGIK